MAGDANGLGHQYSGDRLLKGLYTGYIAFLFCYKYMQVQNAGTKYFVLLILTFDEYDL